MDNNQVTSLYVSNFPSRWIPSDIHLVMFKFSEVLEVFIPGKVNKQGKRFAFVRFRSNTATSYLIHQINLMQVDGVRLSANLAKDRIKNSYQNNNDQKPTDVLATNKPYAGKPTFLHQHKDDRSFADVVHGNEEIPSENRSFNPIGDSALLLQSCIIGVLKALIPIGTLTEFFAKTAPKVSKIIPIGEVSFLFMFQTSDDMTCMIMNQPEWVHLMFSSLREWKEGDATVDRLCWSWYVGYLQNSGPRISFELPPLVCARWWTGAPRLNLGAGWTLLRSLS
ncbi:hypothetical protein Tsubulata_029957 [Turnera subulata]|uniref:RRM domain-containing protein n=1 Tax=Turnera subulata TaxID=218843 RepID=A0A9Q0F7N0_9ROSI|nr:hypothetical protein Tsubulata_029957 [Turnera subulata]